MCEVKNCTGLRRCGENNTTGEGAVGEIGVFSITDSGECRNTINSVERRNSFENRVQKIHKGVLFGARTLRRKEKENKLLTHN